MRSLLYFLGISASAAAASVSKRAISCGSDAPGVNASTGISTVILTPLGSVTSQHIGIGYGRARPAGLNRFAGSGSVPGVTSIGMYLNFMGAV